MVHVGVAVVVISASPEGLGSVCEREGDDGIDEEGRRWDYGSVTIED